MSAEKATKLSKVIPLAQPLLQKARLSTLPLSKSLEKQMLARKFDILETFSPLSQATVLDPRFKKIAFKDDANNTQVKRAIQEEMTRKPEMESNQDSSGPSTSRESTSSAKADDLWQDFDNDGIKWPQIFGNRERN